MSRIIIRQPKDYEWWAMACCSLLLHLSVYLLILNAHFSPHLKEAPVYYVDVVNLPVASPQAGTPSETRQSPAPPQPATSPPREMTYPSKPSAKTQAKIVPAIPPKPSEITDSSREFEERMARLEQEAGERHQAAALEALKKKENGKTAAGMPGGAGTQAGSDYASYIQSRLTDAFKTTIAFQAKNPEVLIKLTVNRNGRIVRMRMERSSGDKIFEDSVSRAIAKAEKSFPPPPTHENFEAGFVFRPQGVGKR